MKHPFESSRRHPQPLRPPRGRRLLLWFLACLGAALAAPWAGAQQPAPLDWPQLQRDAARSGRTTIFAGPQVRAKWIWVDEQHITRDFQSQRDAKIAYPKLRTLIIAGDVQPIVAEGKVFFGADDGQFFALNASDASTVWKARTGGPILHTAAYADGRVVIGSMDHNIYCFSAADGRQLWRVTTGAGVHAAPLIVGGQVFIGSRDGVFYAIDLSSGQVQWTYRPIAASPEDPFSGAPIVQPAASDGQNIFFGAENMWFYCLDARSGQEKWRSKLRGQSFQYSWPVIVGEHVMVPVMTSAGNAEFVAEKELDDLPRGTAQEVWPLERQMFLKWLKDNPHQQSMWVLDKNTGREPYIMPLGRVGGLNYPPRAPVIYSDGRPLIYWRTKTSTVLTGGTFGSKYTPDISAVNMATGDREYFTPPRRSGAGAEIDNNFTLTVGGDWVYMNNHMRGAHMVNPKTGVASRLTSIMADWDGANFRNWGNQIIYWGNDTNRGEDLPPSAHRAPQGDSGIAIVEVDGRPTLIFSESGHYQIDFGAIVALESR
jgi:outer membrane protein assembly factor BamB